MTKLNERSFVRHGNRIHEHPNARLDIVANRAIWAIKMIMNNDKKFRSFKSKENIIRKKLAHTAVSAIKASSVTL